jgi:serine/threonine-protein kinase
MEQAAAQDRLLGAKVGNYEVKQKLGEGGMGAVYLAVHPNIGKRVALKVLHPEFSSNEDVIGRFFTEAKAVNDIQHPNIVDIIDYGEMPPIAGIGQKVVYFIMEFLAGDSLAKVIHDQAPISPERAQMIAIQVADALGASHRHGIVHRDLKPDNVMISQRRDGRDFVKVLDFGIAKLTGDHQGSRRTRTGIVMGTPAYMSPEQCEGRGNVDPRTDIYALGILLYEMLAGQVPFRGEGYGEVLVQHMTQVPRRPSTIRGVLPPHLEAVCMRALEKRPSDRFADMETFLVALQDPVAYVEEHGGLDGFLSYGRNPVPLYGPGSSQHGYPMQGGHPGYAPNLAPTSMTPYPSVPADHAQRMTTPMGAGGAGMPMPTPPPGSLGGRADVMPAFPTPPPGQLRKGGMSGSKIAVVAIGAVALGVGAFFVYRGMAGGKPAHREPVVAAPTPRPPVEEHPPTDPPGEGGKIDPQTPPAAVKVEIAVASSPAGAAVFVNGEAEPRGKTPVTLDLARSDMAVELLLKAEGFADKRESVVPSENRALDLVLTAVAVVPEKPPVEAGKGESSTAAEDREKKSRERKHRREREKGKGKDGPTTVGDDVIRPDL